MTSALRWGGWLAPRPGRFTPRKKSLMEVIIFSVLEIPHKSYYIKTRKLLRNWKKLESLTNTAAENEEPGVEITFTHKKRKRERVKIVSRVVCS